MGRLAIRMDVVRVGLVAVAVVCIATGAPAARPMSGELPAVELKPQDQNVWEHRVGPLAAIHVTAEEYRAAQRGREYVEFEIVVSENGRVDSAKLMGKGEGHEDEARAIEMARVFKPWMQDGSPVRVKVRDDVQLLPPELWADVRVAFPDPWELNSVSVGLKRTSCYGTCPAYEVTISGDGTVRFSGGSIGVMIPGDHVALVSPDAVRELVGEFREADFLSARNEYRGGWTDNPTQTLSLSVAGQTKTVVDYVGTDAGLPLAIRNLEGKIDEVAGTARWVKGDERTLKSLEDEKWPFAAATKQNVALFVTAISTKNEPLVERYMAADGPIVAHDEVEVSPVCAASAMGDLGLVERMMAPAAATGGPRKRAEIPAWAMQQCLSSAARGGNVEVLQYWMDAGANPLTQPVKNAVDWTSGLSLLANGVMSGNTEVVRKLLEYKLDVKAPVQEEPLLSFAIQRGGKEAPEIVKLLATAGADANARGNGGETPIFSAEYLPAAVKPLLAAGADIEARMWNGDTPLIRFAYNEGMVKELLADGADPTAIARNGDTALKMAKQSQCAPCATLIEAALKQRVAGGVGAANIP
jgi:ankyrin repeat protein